jgi:hypothetical protein
LVPELSFDFLLLLQCQGTDVVGSQATQTELPWLQLKKAERGGAALLLQSISLPPWNSALALPNHFSYKSAKQKLFSKARATRVR